MLQDDFGAKAARARDAVMRRPRSPRRGRRSLFATGLGLVAAAAGAPGIAQAEPSGGAFEFARETVSAPLIASAENGRALTAWGTGGGAAARVLGRTSPLTSRSALRTGTDTGPGVLAAKGSSGRYLRVWAEWTENPCCFGVRDYKFFSQVLDRNGAGVGQPALVETSSPDGSVLPVAVTWNPRTRQWLLLGAVRDEGYDLLYSRLLTEGGAPVAGSVNEVDTRTPQGTTSTALALRPRDGSYLVTWTEQGVIRGQILNAAGQDAAAPFDVTRHSNLVGQIDNNEPSIAVDPVSNEAMVAWSDRYEAFARRITARGVPTGSDLRVSRMGPASDPDWLTSSPDVAYSPAAGQYLVVWQSGPGDEPSPAGESVYGQHLSRTGGQIGTDDFPIATLDRAVEPAVTAFAGGTDFLVAWSSRRASPSGWARRVTRTP